MTGSPAAFRCSDDARRRADPLVGSAPATQAWLLLEHPGPWSLDAVAGSGIDPSVLRALGTAARSAGARILLVRRPGRTPRGGTRSWWLLGPDRPAASGVWASDADLAAAVAALRAEPVGAPAAADLASEPLLLVCAHGTHDVCCAVRGRPVAAALAARWPDRVWECSHLGGCRFAPSVVVLPDGHYYGNLDPASAVAAVEAHLAGTVRVEHLRGWARLPPAAQAAAVAVHERFGPLGPRDVTLAGLTHTPPQGDRPAHSEVDLQVRGAPGPVRVEVVELRRPEAQLTCRAARQTPATEYRVVAVHPSSPSQLASPDRDTPGEPVRSDQFPQRGRGAGATG